MVRCRAPWAADSRGPAWARVRANHLPLDLVINDNTAKPLSSKVTNPPASTHSGKFSKYSFDFPAQRRNSIPIPREYATEPELFARYSNDAWALPISGHPFLHLSTRNPTGRKLCSTKMEADRGVVRWPELPALSCL